MGGLWRWYKLLGSGSPKLMKSPSRWKGGRGGAPHCDSSQGSEEEARRKAARQRSSLGLGLRPRFRKARIRMVLC